MKLVNRLLTGKDRQIRNSLHSPRGFCVLGVLCDIYLNERGETWGHLFGWDHCGTPPLKVRAWAGLTGRESEVLMQANDNLGVTFPGMVDLLMKNPIFDDAA